MFHVNIASQKSHMYLLNTNKKVVMQGGELLNDIKPLLHYSCLIKNVKACLMKLKTYFVQLLQKYNI